MDTSASARSLSAPANALAASRRDMTATALAQATGGTLATTHRFLVALEEMGAVFRSPRGHFMLGHKLAELGARVETPRLLTEAVQPHLDAVAAEFREVAHCATLSGAAAVDVARALPRGARSSRPLRCSASWRASARPATRSTTRNGRTGCAPSPCRCTIRAERIAHALFTESRVFPQKAKPRGSFPHLKRVGDFIFLSGTSAWRSDDSFEGVHTGPDGAARLDIATQTRAVFGNISDMLRELGAGLDTLVEVQAYLVDRDHYDAFNAAYATFFGPNGPTRTTLVVRALPHPHQILMVRAVAHAPLATLEAGRPAMTAPRW